MICFSAQNCFCFTESQCTGKTPPAKMKKAWQCKSKFKAMLIVSCDIKCTYGELGSWRSNSEATLLQTDCRKGQKKTPELWEKGFIFHSGQCISTFGTRTETVLSQEMHCSFYRAQLHSWDFGTPWNEVHAWNICWFHYRQSVNTFMVLMNKWKKIALSIHYL